MRLIKMIRSEDILLQPSEIYYDNICPKCGTRNDKTLYYGMSILSHILRCRNCGELYDVATEFYEH